MDGTKRFRRRESNPENFDQIIQHTQLKADQCLRRKTVIESFVLFRLHEC
jgi:hypothetical protein